MEFKDFKILLQENFKQMTQEASHLFEVGLDKDELWNLYLDSFPEGTNPTSTKSLPIFLYNKAVEC
jgi:hypothetical protein